MKWIVFLLLTGCVVQPYMELGIGHQLNRGNRDGRNPVAHIELGFEGKNFYCGFHHQSKVREDIPFNRNQELYIDDIRCSKKWGGWK